MYCGPVRHRMTGGSPEDDGIERKLAIHETEHPDPDNRGGEASPAIQTVFRGLVEDHVRTGQICADIAAASRAGRNCLVLSQWTAHVRLDRGPPRRVGVKPVVLVGGVGMKERRGIIDALAGAQPGDGAVLVATGSLLGEGFDCPPLDTLFLAFPIAFRGRIVQYVGRVLRPLEDKRRIEVHDYVDAKVPVLARMLTKRLGAYASLGFDLRGVGAPPAVTLGRASAGSAGIRSPRQPRPRRHQKLGKRPRNEALLTERPTLAFPRLGHNA